MKRVFLHMSECAITVGCLFKNCSSSRRIIDEFEALDRMHGNMHKPVANNNGTNVDDNIPGQQLQLQATINVQQQQQNEMAAGGSKISLPTDSSASM